MFNLINRVFAFVCGAALVGSMLMWLPLGLINATQDDPTCCCEYCDPTGRKAKRLGLSRH